MNKMVYLLAALILMSNQNPGYSDDDWKLVWSDEFNSTKLDYSKWGVEVNAFGGGNQELQLYTDRSENIRLENGCLIIEARKDRPNIQGTIRDYSSGRLRTKYRGDWKYGKFEVRARVPEGKGLWPAIWMLPTDEKYGSWALSGEIDIMEFDGAKPDHVLGTLHYGDKWPNNRQSSGQYVLKQGKFSEEFHVYGLEWERGEIKWYVDGVHYQTKTKWDSQASPFPAPFDQRFHLLLNLSVGGGLVGAPDANTIFPKRFEIDYVRVYQRKKM